MIKNNLRLTFKKSNRNPFIEKFKTQVRQSKSIDAVRLTPPKNHANSQTPFKQKTVVRKMIGINTTIKNKSKSKQKTPKTIKIKVSQKQKSPIKQNQQISNFQQDSGSLIDILKQSPRKQKVSNVYKSNIIGLSGHKNEAQITQQMIEATNFLLHHSKQLKKYQLLEQQTQQLDKVLQKLATKLKKVHESKLEHKVQFLQIPKVNPFIKKKLFTSNQIVLEQEKQSSGLSSRRCTQKNSNLEYMPSSINSFKIQNQSSHENQHFYIYQDGKPNNSHSHRAFTYKQSSNASQRNIAKNTSNKVIINKKRQINQIKPRKGSEQIKKVQVYEKKNRKYSEQNPKPLDSLEQIVLQQSDQARIYSTHSSSQNERKRNILNEIICLVNKKYSKGMKKN